MKSRLVFVLPLLASLLAACQPDFEESSSVTKLRMLALKAEPPEISLDSSTGAPDRATLDVLVGHPDFVTDASRRTTVVHVTCTPSTSASATTACTTLTELSDPMGILAQADLTAACTNPGVGAVDGITISGVQSCGASGCEDATILRDPNDTSSAVTLPSATYIIPSSLALADLPAGQSARVLGVEVIDLALLLDVAPSALAPSTAASDSCAALTAFLQNFESTWSAQEHVAGVKRLLVRGPDAIDDLNQNPAIDGILLSDGSALPSQISPGNVLNLIPEYPANATSLHQSYTMRDSTGVAVSQETEEWIAAWFATAGEMDKLHTTESASEEWTAPDSAGDLIFYTVVYDQRRGVSWVRTRSTVSQ